jgi:nucleotide-binding universal stress UspA family protein
MATIVVGVDPSTAGRRALAFALREAVLRGAEVVAVRAWEPPSFALTYPIPAVVTELEQDVAAQALALAEEQLKLAVDDVPGADSVERRAVAVRGPAARVLVEAARDAALLVVGTRGHGALSRAVLGSVSSSVAHLARGSVAVVPASAELDAPVRRVLVGVDHSPQSSAALRWAVDEAELHDARLVPVHVHQHIVTGEECVDLPALEQSERASLAAAAAAAGAASCTVEADVVIGHPAAALEALASPADLLVVGSRGRGGFAGLLLGSTSTQLAQHASAPVLIVRSC